MEDLNGFHMYSTKQEMGSTKVRQQTGGVHLPKMAEWCCPQGPLISETSSPIQVSSGLLVLKDSPLEMVNNFSPKIAIPGNSVEQRARNCHQESNKLHF